MAVQSKALAQKVLEPQELSLSEAVKGLHRLGKDMSLRNYSHVIQYQEEAGKILDETQNQYGEKTMETLQEMLSKDQFTEAFEYIKTREKDYDKEEYFLE